MRSAIDIGSSTRLRMGLDSLVPKLVYVRKLVKTVSSALFYLFVIHPSKADGRGKLSSFARRTSDLLLIYIWWPRLLHSAYQSLQPIPLAMVYGLSGTIALPLYAESSPTPMFFYALLRYELLEPALCMWTVLIS